MGMRVRPSSTVSWTGMSRIMLMSLPAAPPRPGASPEKFVNAAGATFCVLVFSTSPDMLTTTSAPVPIGKAPDHERLTPRESEVLTYLSKGFTIKEIASLMGIKWFTVNDHIKSIYKKLNVSSRAEAAVLASKQGLV